MDKPVLILNKGKGRLNNQWLNDEVELAVAKVTWELKSYNCINQSSSVASQIVYSGFH